MNTKAWLMPGQPCGRHIILEQCSRGNRVQRYRAHDPAMNQPVLITCAKACRDHEKPRFEALAAMRAQIPSTPRMLDWGMSNEGIFYVAEEDLGAQALTSLKIHADDTAPDKALLAKALPCFALLYSLAEELCDFAEKGFWHGAIDPVATFKLHHGDPVLEGMGFLQILGCTQGPELDEGSYFAPEVLAGQQFDERADVFSVCAFILDMLRGERSQTEAFHILGDLAEPFMLGLKTKPEERPAWKALLGSIKKAFAKLTLASSTQTERIIEALNHRHDEEQQKNTPRTQPRSARTDALVRKELLLTYRDLHANQIKAKAPAPQNTAQASLSKQTMPSSEAEPITLRSGIPLPKGVKLRRTIGLGLSGAITALIAFWGLLHVYRTEVHQLEPIQWPTFIVLSIADTPPPLPKPACVEESAPQAPPPRREARRKRNLCEVVPCPPGGQNPKN